MTRPRDQIMRDLRAILAELDYGVQEEGGAVASGAAMAERIAGKDEPEISPKLAQALAKERPLPPEPTHEELRLEAKGWRKDKPVEPHAPPEREIYDPVHGFRRERDSKLKDYTAVDDPNWPDDSTWLGTGDQRLID